MSRRLTTALSATVLASALAVSACGEEAATKPSPPLFPLPQTTAIRPAGARRAITWASPSPARSMRSSEGTLRSSIAQRSVARI